MKKWKKWTAPLCAGEMLVSLTACGTQPAGSDSMAAYAGQSVTEQITVLDGTSVTLQIGELSQSDDMQPSDATPPEKPESDASGDTAAEDAGTQPSDATLPEKPEGDATGETTEQTTGAQPSDMTLPDKPEGDDSAAMDGSALPDGQTPPDALPGGQTFTAGTQTMTGDISVDAISSLQMRLCSGSTYTGAIQMVENAQRGTSADAQVNVTIESGNLTLTATDDALHSDGALTITGGTVLAAGGSGSMGMQLTTEQPYLLQQSGAAIVAGETLSIADADGTNILDACQAPCTVSFLFYTSPDLTDGQSYTLQGSGSASAQLEAQIGALQGGMMPGGPAGGPGADGERLDTQPPGGQGGAPAAPADGAPGVTST